MHQIFLPYGGTELRGLFWKLAALCLFFTKKQPFSGHFSWKIGINLPIFKIFKNALLICSPIWWEHLVQISANLSKNWRSWYVWREIFQNLTFSIFYKRSYQNCELQSAIAFERKLILTLCKKPLFPLMELFQITQNENFDPDQIPPPIALMLIWKVHFYGFQKVLNNFSTKLRSFCAIFSKLGPKRPQNQ